MFWDESGASLLPVTRRTWAPRSHTPVIRHHFKWKRASMAAALCYGCQRSWLVVEPLPGCAPELNPVEGLWANLKGVELANPGIEGLRGQPVLTWTDQTIARSGW